MEKVRSIHVVGKLDRGGVETWLKEISVTTGTSSLQLDIMLTRNGEGAYDKIFIHNKSKLHRNALTKWNLIFFCYRIYKLLKKEKTMVMHSHVHHFSGLILFISYLAKVKVRIAHSHSNTNLQDTNAGFGRSIYLKFMLFLINRFSTARLACSPEAGIALFGEDNFRILKLGIDLERFENADLVRRKAFLAEYQIQEDALIVGHVGRFVTAKNHGFLLDAFKQVLSKNNNAYLILVGEGNLYDDVKEKINLYQIEGNVKLLGVRDDIAFLLRNIFSVMAMPSLYEGSPVILLEAQAAGLNSIVSDQISAADRILPELFKTVDLSSSSRWADSIIQCNKNADSSKVDCLNIVAQSEYNIKNSVASLIEIYSEQ